jgi:hypothetical protein
MRTFFAHFGEAENGEFENEGKLGKFCGETMKILK